MEEQVSGSQAGEQESEDSAWLYNVKHETVCLLKPALERDASWGLFLAQVNRFKQQVSPTVLEGLTPQQH